MKKAGGFGMVVLVIVLAVVLLLVARQWKAVAPTAMQIDDRGNVAVVPETHGEDAAGEALQRGGLPDLNGMRQATSSHQKQVEDAFATIE